MRILMDSHVFVWAKSAPKNLRDETLAAIIDPDNEAFVSVATAWELWIKHAKKPILTIAAALNSGTGFRDAALESGIALLEIKLEHAAMAAALPAIHRDPFDRMLIAQAIAEQMTIVTNDTVFKRY